LDGRQSVLCDFTSWTVRAHLVGANKREQGVEKHKSPVLSQTIIRLRKHIPMRGVTRDAVRVANRTYGVYKTVVPHSRQLVVYFGGDQLSPDRSLGLEQEVLRLADVSTQTQLVSQHFPECTTLTIEPCRLNDGYACYDTFLNNTTASGEPLGYSCSHPTAAPALAKIVQGATGLDVPQMAAATWKLVAFSKGGVVLNQILTELAWMVRPQHCDRPAAQHSTAQHSKAHTQHSTAHHTALHTAHCILHTAQHSTVGLLCAGAQQPTQMRYLHTSLHARADGGPLHRRWAQLPRWVAQLTAAPPLPYCCQTSTCPDPELLPPTDSKKWVKSPNLLHCRYNDVPALPMALWGACRGPPDRPSRRGRVGFPVEGKGWLAHQGGAARHPPPVGGQAEAVDLAGGTGVPAAAAAGRRACGGAQVGACCLVRCGGPSLDACRGCLLGCQRWWACLCSPNGRDALPPARPSDCCGLAMHGVWVHVVLSVDAWDPPKVAVSSGMMWS
jgi:hypothetical protein